MRYVLYDKKTRQILLISNKPITPSNDSQLVATTEIEHNYIYIDVDGSVKELPKTLQESLQTSEDVIKRQRFYNLLKEYVKSIKQELEKEYFIPIDKTDILRVISTDLQIPFEDIYIDFRNTAEKLITGEVILSDVLQTLPEHELSYLAIVQFQYDLIIQKLNKLYLDKLSTLKSKDVNEITLDDYRFSFQYTLQV